nr:hypothetical protein [Tanacetum cinerariifolium]
MTASYSASLLVAMNSNFRAYVNSLPSGLTIIKPALESSSLNDPSVYSLHHVLYPFSFWLWKSVSSSAKKSARTCALIAFLGLYSISCSSRTALTHSFEAVKYTIRLSPAFGATRRIPAFLNSSTSLEATVLRSGAIPLFFCYT